MSWNDSYDVEDCTFREKDKFLNCEYDEEELTYVEPFD